VYGPVANHHVAEMKDLDGREFLVLGTLAAAVFLMGIYPGPLLHMMGATVHHLVDQAVATKIPLLHAAITP
ncbi:MAG: NADH-quinone oxidoreductase subunit M, partial [Steroidobacteraceae bacterium]